ncbi:MAG: dipeptide epimerase [Alphaproteobacteria bacterium]|nr:dipeptide epimerase [Alphaproteobacteria bacterium]
MRITRADVICATYPLAQPYTIAYETVDTARFVFLVLETDGPHRGFGAAAPDPPVTGETLEGCEAALIGITEALVGEDPLRRVHLLERSPLVGHPAARAALDMALLDLLGKAAGLPVVTLLGGYRRSMPTSVTVFIDTPERMLAEARARLAQGFEALKIKGGLDPEGDADILRRIRAAVGPQVALRFDANQGYSVAEARRFLAAIEGVELEMFEQPTRRGQGEDLMAVTQASPYPVMADESLLNLDDAFRLARYERVDMLNVKLMKVGGVDAALHVAAVARAAELSLMVGSTDECALSVAAGLHLALACPEVRFADLDGHLDLANDPTDGAVRLEKGWLFPCDAPGFGVTRLKL